ncbi:MULTISPECIES: hypothetical protein [Pantoea]|uniref:hypothetical protein n=1 Tax=Pantoea TaxID=53335 RepID=UPI00211803FA|nr:hypothetical protein [Pantoea sp. Fr+CA_20]
MILSFESGPSTVIDPLFIEYLEQPAGMMDGVKEISLSKDRLLQLQGEFGDFKIYHLVTHSRVMIVPESVCKLCPSSFKANVRFELTPGDITEKTITFWPRFKFTDVRAVNFGLFPDSFGFTGDWEGTKAFPCDLSFLLNFAELHPPIPCRVEYIGIAKAEGREAQDRLGEGHDKLQTLLAEQNSRQSLQTVSIVLYRPSPLEPPLLSFPDIIETFEAMMIRHFKPRFNTKALNFPKNCPTLVEKLMNIGVQEIIAQIESPEGVQLFSDSVAPADEHFPVVELE